MTDNTGIDNNSGYGNSGDWNSGDWNSGNRNSGTRNSGYGNSGNRNSGNGNSGNWNSGDRNSGDRNSGDWNMCDYETGAFNTYQADTIRVFNEPCSRAEWERANKPLFIYFDLCVWVDESDMTDAQKKEDPDFHARGGQLQTKEYKQAWREAYAAATPEDIELLKALPNFDADVFEELTGIKVGEKTPDCSGREVEIDGVKYKLERIKS